MSAVTFLGTGPGDVAAGRFQSSILLECDDRNILLDAGEPCCGQLLELGFALADLDAIWITHAHADHVGGLPLLIQASLLHGRTEPLPLGLPAHFHEPFLSWMAAIQLPPDRLEFSLEIFDWQSDQSRIFGGLEVIPRRTAHMKVKPDAGSTPVPESFLFDITHSGGRIGYSGDLGAAGDLEPLLVRPMDVLICELAHLSLDDLLATLAGAQIGTLCLTHLPAALDEQRGVIKERCGEELSGVDAVYLPEDGERIAFS